MRSRFLIAYEPTLFNFGFFPQALLVRAQSLLLNLLGDLRFELFKRWNLCFTNIINPAERIGVRPQLDLTQIDLYPYVD